MGSVRNKSSIVQSAAFALFEALRQVQGAPVAHDGSIRLTYLRTVDAAATGLGWTNAGDDALELRWGQAPTALGESLWVHAKSDGHGPYLGLYIDRDRPTMQARFAGSSFVPVEDGKLLLRERPTFSSHDGLLEMREDLVRRYASAWRVPMDGPWLHIGRWDELNRTWDPDAVRRLVAVALILEAAKRLDPDFLNS